MLKVLWDFEMHTDPLIPPGRLDLVMKNKKKRTCRIVVFAVPSDHSEHKRKLKERRNYTYPET